MTPDGISPYPEPGSLPPLAGRELGWWGAAVLAPRRFLDWGVAPLPALPPLAERGEKQERGASQASALFGSGQAALHRIWLRGTSRQRCGAASNSLRPSACARCADPSGASTPAQPDLELRPSYQLAFVQQESIRLRPLQDRAQCLIFLNAKPYQSPAMGWEKCRPASFHACGDTTAAG